MPRFEPFRGIRYNLDRVELADVTAPPYDVIDADERAELVRRHPDNVVVVDLPVADDDDGEDAYERAAATFATWRRERVLVEDPDPAFYVYRMNFTDERGRHHHTTGVLGALELAPPGESVGGEQPILPHEYTTPKAKSDRLRLLRATEVNLSPVWALSPARGLSQLLDTGKPPLAAWTDDDGVAHELWVLDDPLIVEQIETTVRSEPVLIADGHHRYETSLTYQQERDAADGPGLYDAALVYLVELDDAELSVLPIHRLVRGLPAGFDLLGALDAFFEVGPLPSLDGVAEQMEAADALTLITREGAWLLRPRAEAMRDARDLDTSRLDVALAALPDHELIFQHGVEQVVNRVRKGDVDAGFLLRPATVAQIIEIAKGGERMPPKTTFFHPKPRTGVVFRTLS